MYGPLSYKNNFWNSSILSFNSILILKLISHLVENTWLIKWCFVVAPRFCLFVIFFTFCLLFDYWGHGCTLCFDLIKIRLKTFYLKSLEWMNEAGLKNACPCFMNQLITFHLGINLFKMAGKKIYFWTFFLCFTHLYLRLLCFYN